MAKEFNVIETRDLILKEKNLQLIDVRSPEEFAKGAIPHFKNIPLPDLSRELPTLDGKKKTIVIGESTHESKSAQQLLQACGIDTFSVRGGLSDWRQVISEKLEMG